MIKAFILGLSTMRALASVQLTSVVLFFLALLVPVVSSAVEYSAQPSISLQGAYDDNILLTTQPHPSVSSGILTPQLDLAAAMENWQITATGRLRSVRYSGNTGLDTNDKFLNFSSSLIKERTQWRLSGATSKESTLLSEKFTPDLGIVRTQTHHTTRSIAPAWSALLTEATELKLDYQSSDVSYDKGVRGPFNDYQNNQTNISLSNVLTSRTQIFISGSNSAFEVPVAEYRSKTNSWQLGLTSDFSETVKATFSAGGRKTTSERVVPCDFISRIFGLCTADRIDTTKDSGSVYNVNIQKQLERTGINVTLNRGIDPSGSATQIQTDTASVGVNHNIAQSRLTAGFNASGYRSKAIGGNAASYPARDYYLLESSLSWRWTERLTLSGSYRRVRLKFRDIDAAPVSNSVQVTISYQAPKLSISR